MNTRLFKEDDFSVNGFGTGQWSQMFGAGSISGGKFNDAGEWDGLGTSRVEGAMLAKFERTGVLNTTNLGIYIYLEDDDDNYAVFLEENSANNLRFRSRLRDGGSSFDHVTGPEYAVGAAPSTHWFRVLRQGTGQQSGLLVADYNGDPDAGGTLRSAFGINLSNSGGSVPALNNGRWGLRGYAANAKADLVRFYEKGDPASGGGSGIVVPTSGQVWPRGVRRV